MGHTNIKRSTVKNPYQETKKDKGASSGSSVISNKSQSTGKDSNNSSWGPVYKNKQNFIDMHIC